MHFKRLRFALALAILTSGFGCKQRSTSSALEGHYEGRDQEAALRRQSGRLVIPPQYAPTRAVLVSDRSFLLYGMWELARAITSSGADLWLLGSKSKLSSESMAQKIRLKPRAGVGKVIPVDVATDSAWVRDYAPLVGYQRALKPGDPSRLVLIDQNYYPDRKSDDYLPTVISEMMLALRFSLPVYNEGGNFMTSGRHCLMTERVLEANTAQAMTKDPKERVLDALDVEEYYRIATGCERVTIFPRMPYEGTGHIDMWAKVIGDDLVVVSQLDGFAMQDPLPDLGERIERDVRKPSDSVLSEVQSFLDARAQDFERLGFRVLRIAMPLPVALPPLKGAPEGSRTERTYLFRSYANALIVNDSIIVPDYVKPDNPELNGSYPDDKFTDFYRSNVLKVFSDRSRMLNGKRLPPLKVLWVNADQAIATGGAVHCLTMQVPK